MSKPPVEITICMGSSCFSRGNRKVLLKIKEYLKEKDIEDQVVFKGSHCFGQCEHGPVLKIGETIFQRVDLDKLEHILRENLQIKFSDQQ